MPPKAKAAAVNKKDAEKAEAERLKKEQEDLEAERKLQLEAAQRQAQEEARKEAELWNSFPESFRFRVAQVGWRVNNPAERCQHHSFNLNGKLHVLGGYEPEANGYLYTLDHDGKRWSKLSLSGTPPQTVAGQSSVAYNESIYVFGGYTAKGGFKPELFRLDLESLTWSAQRYSGECPRFYAMSAVVYDNYMICFGGKSIEQIINPDVYLLDLTSFEWKRIITFGTIPTPRYWHSAIIFKNHMWVYGGLDLLDSAQPSPGRDGGSGNVIYCLNLETWEWLALEGVGRGPGLNNRIYGHACSQFKNGLVLTGGNNNDRVYVLNLVTLRWSIPVCVGDDLKFPRMFHSTTAFHEREMFVLFGGKQRKSDKCCNDVYYIEMLRDKEW